MAEISRKHPARKAKDAVITMRDVARESGCSATTVSIVLNNAPLARYIPPSTKDRIEKVAKKLGYRPKVVARYLRSKRNHTVGVMVFDLLDPFCTLILRGIENALYQASYLPVLTDAHNQRELGFMRFAVAVARRAGVTAADILNTRPLPEFLKGLRRSRNR